MQFGHLVLILVMAVPSVAACGSPSSAGSHDTGGGIIVYWNSDIRLMPDLVDSPGTLLATSVTGFQTVEVLNVAPDSITPTPMPTLAQQGDCYPMPISLTTFVDELGSTEIAVQDPCGNYRIHAAPGSPSVMGWSTELGPYAHPYAEIGTDSAGRSVSALGDDYTVSFSRREQGLWAFLGDLPVPFNRGIHMTRVVLPVGDDVWAVQGGGEIDVVNIGGMTETVESRVMTQAEVPPPYLVPFDGYDHLTALPWAICPDKLIGVGTFHQPGAQVSPRRLVVLDISNPESGAYSARDFGSPGFEPTNVASLVLGDAKTMVVGSIGRHADGWAFKVFEAVGCIQLAEVTEVEVEFDFKTAPLPGFGRDAHQQRSDGAKLAAYWDPDSNTASFAHYDGYDLRVFKAQKSADVWQAWQETTRLHETREDLSVPARK